MSLAWVWITLAAAAVQTLRFMLQKKLAASGLSVGGATFSRFLFGAPIAAVAAAMTLAILGQGMPATGPLFWVMALIGGAAQVGGTFLTVALFRLRNFAVGIAFTKTETVQVAVIALLVLGESVSSTGWIGIAVGLIGVLALSRPAGGFSARATVYGVLAGGLFGLSAVCYRGATLELLPLAAFPRAVVTLACVTAAQTIGMGLYLHLREAGELGRVLMAWRRTIWVGVAGIAGSMGWFLAFALQGAAYVRALGQVEIVFTLLASVFVFHERLTGREAVGIALVVLSLILLVLGGR